ncbi:MAG TPA: glycosyltransferase, partial [Xanthobacteraceae bacterium]|nr:glycosyltransferase [Xanthobacteraceae bacterium]
MLNGVVAAAAVAVWMYLICARGAFWLGRERDDAVPGSFQQWPAVAAVVPARNEADCVQESIGSLLRQDYPGAFTVILVDDDSSDGTADIARAAAPAGDDRLRVVQGAPLPPGWTGKLWAVKQGIDATENLAVAREYLLLTDADIVHSPDSVRWLVAHARAGGYVLTSLMAKLRCESLVERIHVPAFIFFFQMLYPFSWVNRARAATAAAAGGCMLVHADALRLAGGIVIIRDAL